MRLIAAGNHDDLLGFANEIVVHDNHSASSGFNDISVFQIKKANAAIDKSNFIREIERYGTTSIAEVYVLCDHTNGELSSRKLCNRPWNLV